MHSVVATKSHSPVFKSIIPPMLSLLTVSALDSLIPGIHIAQRQDPTCLQILSDLSKFPSCSQKDGILYYCDRLLVPDVSSRQAILFACHDSLFAGHMGFDKTLDLISRNFYWPTMRLDTIAHVTSCLVCQKSKSLRSLKFGRPSPLPIPSRNWSHIHLDFAVGFPPIQGFDAVLIVVCRRTKQVHFLPARSNFTALDTAMAYIQHVFRLHGIPDSIVSDRGPQFLSAFWNSFWKLLRSERRLTTAYHPQSDGQAENLVKSLKTYLRAFVTDTQNDWLYLLPFAELPIITLFILLLE